MRHAPMAAGAPRPKGRTRPGDLIFRGLTGASAFGVLGIFVLSILLLIEASQKSLARWGPGFLWGQVWNPNGTPSSPEVFGALPAVLGTVETSFLAMLIAVPLSLGIAVFLTELSPSWLRGPFSFVIELLAAIPSVVFGIWGALFLVPYMGTSVDPGLAATVGRVPVLGAPFAPSPVGYTGDGSLTAGIILAIMVIPTVAAISREAFKAVPNDLREAALSLGATRWETTRLAVLPYAKRGVLGAITLGLGRAIGETIAVVLVIGNSYTIARSLYAPSVTIASWIANAFGESSGLEREGLLELGLVLLGLSLLVNIAARIILRRSVFTEGMGT
ncbi:MAG TPA: phosphate ABC transporter permease subunit PstC [Thermoplasmata archaeon]|nr:phosphate ABC transporter permease subunit PstC [Thermoplasmata archaeon]